MGKMFSVKAIVAKNTETFYNYRTNKKIRVWPRIVIFIALSALLGAFVDTDMQDLLDGVITVQSILIGFSFTVMFFLVSKDPLPVPPSEDCSIEGDLKGIRINKLSQELFYNVSYFNVVAISCVAMAVFMMMPNESIFAWSVITRLPEGLLGKITSVYSVFIVVFLSILRFAFFFLLIESAYTFARTTARITHLFEEKLPAEVGAD